MSQEQEPNPGIFLTPEEARELIKKGEASFPELENLPGFEPPELEEEAEKAFRKIFQGWQKSNDGNQEK